MIYQRKTAIEKGEKRIKNIRKWLFISAIIVLAVFYLGFMAPFLIIVILNNKTFETDSGLYIAFFITAILYHTFSFILYYLSILKREPLMEGAKQYEKEIKKAVWLKNYEYRTNHPHDNSYYSSKYSKDELLDLLRNKEEVEYYGIEDIIFVKEFNEPKEKSNIQVGSLSSSNKEEKTVEEEIDEYLNGEREFSDLSDETEVFYFENIDDD